MVKIQKSIVFGFLMSGMQLFSMAPEERTPLISASRKGDIAAVRELLGHPETSLEQKWKGKTPLMYAAEKGHLAVVQALVAAGADVRAQNDRGETAQFFACLRGRESVAKFLHEQMGGGDEELSDSTSSSSGMDREGFEAVVVVSEPGSAGGMSLRSEVLKGAKIAPGAYVRIGNMTVSGVSYSGTRRR